MRDRGRRPIWRAAAMAIVAGLVVALANPAPRIERSATSDKTMMERAVGRIAATVEHLRAPANEAGERARS